MANNALSALLVVFSVLACGLVVLFGSMIYLSARNASRRRARENEAESFSGLDRDGIRERLPTLTTGDLVMDAYMTKQVESLARELSPKQAPPDDPEAPAADGAAGG